MIVTPAKAGAQILPLEMGPGLRGDEEYGGKRSR